MRKIFFLNLLFFVFAFLFFLNTTKTYANCTLNGKSVATDVQFCSGSSYSGATCTSSTSVGTCLSDGTWKYTDCQSGYVCAYYPSSIDASCLCKTTSDCKSICKASTTDTCTPAGGKCATASPGVSACQAYPGTSSSSTYTCGSTNPNATCCMSTTTTTSAGGGETGPIPQSGGFGGVTSGNVVQCPDGTSGFSLLCNISLTGNWVSGLVTMLFITAAIVALIYLIWGGVKWITSGGDKASLDSARQHVIGAIVGLIIVLLVYFIVNFIMISFGLKGFNLKLPKIIG